MQQGGNLNPVSANTISKNEGKGPQHQLAGCRYPAMPTQFWALFE